MIKKLAKIKDFLNEGRQVEAEIALELFLKFGPQNLEALKLKAFLFSQKGLFAKEYEMWLQIALLAPEDLDVIRYFEEHFLEEKERFYFTDITPDGGRRFLLHPKDLLEACGTGFVSCLVFLFLSSIPIFSHFLSLPFVSLFFVGIFVLFPWFGIIWAYFKMPGDIHISPSGFLLSGRAKQRSLPWGEIEEIYVAHKLRKYTFSLDIIVVPKDKSKGVLSIDISHERSIVKARRFFLAEILSHFPEVKYLNQDRLNLKSFTVNSF